MSCEVAVMNKRGVALAADSVVTVGPAKVYQTAEKLFQLSFDEPVAVMTYGIADMMGVPWETVFKTYRRKLGSRHFDHLEQYGEDFLRYLESSNPLFGPDNQERCFRNSVQNYLVRAALGSIWDKHGYETIKWDKTAWSDLADLLEEDDASWRACDDLETTGAGFGATVVSKYADSLAALQAQLFDKVNVPPKISSALRHTVEMM